jgi:hypothetical protein
MKLIGSLWGSLVPRRRFHQALLAWVLCTASSTPGMNGSSLVAVEQTHRQVATCATASHEILTFTEILRLRDNRDPMGVPALERTLSHYLHSGNISGMAAVQALFCIGTPEAHAGLSRLLLETWPAMEGLSNAIPQWGTKIGSALAWGMPESDANQLIQEYLLRNLSSDLVLELSAQRGKRTGNFLRVEFSVRFSNHGTSTITLIEPNNALMSRMLILRDSSGRFHLPLRVGGGDGSLVLVDVKAGESREFAFWGEVSATEEFRRYHPEGFGSTADSECVLDFNWVNFFLRNGDHDVFAVYEVDRRSDWRVVTDADALREDLRLWSGRAVSTPLKISLPGVEVR